MVSPQPDLIARGLGATDDELGITTEPILRVFIRDSTYALVDELQEWISFSFVPRFNGLGTWSLRIHAKSLAAQYFDEHSGIIVKCYIDDAVETIFSGSISTQWEETSEYIDMAGNCDNILLLSTARPTPSQNEAPYTDDYYVDTDVASTAMMNLVRRNIGPDAPDGWKISALTMGTDPLLGDELTIRARFDTLMTILAESASTPLATGLGFRIIQSDTVAQALVFKVYEPRDMSLDTIFGTEFRTATDYKRTYTRPAANWFQVAGGDDFGINRTIVEGGDTTDIAQQGRRIPAFIDARGTTDTSELVQKLAEQIATVVSTDRISVVPATPRALKYKIHYDLGDLASVIVRGVKYTRIIRDIEFHLSSTDGVIIVPNLADPSASDDDVLVQHLNTLQNRVSNIERNYNIPNDSVIPDMLHPFSKMYAGDLKTTARPGAQAGWLLCDGSIISRSVYANLFLAIGTNFGVGDGSTTFAIPDMRDKVVLGASGTRPLGTYGGSLSAAATLEGTSSATGSHTHVYHHTHNPQSHTHPGEHSHGVPTHGHALDPHDHFFTHSHDIVTDADTIASTTLNTGKRQNTTTTPFGFEEPNVSSGTEDHFHNMDHGHDIPVLDGNTTNQSSNETGEGHKVTGGADFNAVVNAGALTSDPDGNQGSYAAVYSGTPDDSSPNDTDPTDININVDVSVTGNITLPYNPYVAVNWEIFTGVTPT